MVGGQKLNKFVDKHFLKMGEKHPQTHRYQMKCNYCSPDMIILEHCELRCTVHLSKYEHCPNAPEPVWKEALHRLVTKCGVLSSISVDELGTPKNPHVESKLC